MKILNFLMIWIIIFLIVWTLVWSGVKVWQGYNLYPGEYSGFPYEYWQKNCENIKCTQEFNLNNLLSDIGIILIASFLITLFSYKVKGRIR